MDWQTQSNALRAVAFRHDCEVLRLKYLVMPDFTYDWAGHDPSLASSWVDRRLWRRTNDAALFDSAWNHLSARFCKIVDAFFASTGDHAESNFQRYLHSAVKYAIKPRTEQTIDLDFGQIESDEDPTAERDAQEILQLVLPHLSEFERVILKRRFSDSARVAELADEFGLSVDEVSNAIFNAKLRFETLVIERVVRSSIKGNARVRERFNQVISERCTKGEPCFMYRLSCPKAWKLEGRKELELMKSLESEFGVYVSQAIEEYGLASDLSRCFYSR